MKPDEYKFGPEDPRLHGICGAVVGGIVGLICARHFLDSFLMGAGVVVLSAGVCGLLARCCGDKFWTILLKIFCRW